MNPSPRLAAAALAAVTLAVPASAARLQGEVRTADGRPLPLVAVEIRGTDTRTVVTAADGSFDAELAPGAYKVAVATPGLAADDQPVQVAETDVTVRFTARPTGVSERVVVTAERVDAPLANVGSAVSLVDGERLEARQAQAVLDVLQETPGLHVARSGGPGAQGSTFLRGGDSNATRVLVDGVPVNEAGGAFDLGGLVPLELERVEVLRGAASALYGTDALAGVVHLLTRRGHGDPAVRATAEGGSDGWTRGEAGFSGARNAFDWNLGGVRTETDGHVPNGFFEQKGAAASLGWRGTHGTDARLVLRWDTSETGTPGQTAFGRPDLDATIERGRRVAGLTLRHTTSPVVHTLRLGLADNDELSRNPLDSGSYVPSFGGRVAPFEFYDFVNVAGYQNDTTRASFGYQGDAAAGSTHLLSFGVDVERETGALGTAGAELLEPSRTNAGVFAQDRVLLGSRGVLTLGARVERNDSFGTRVVPRGALAFRVREGAWATTLRTSAGLGIKEPSFDESFGTSVFAQGNPDLEPERSRTFDVGVEQQLGARGRVELTRFLHSYRDQIAYRVTDFATFAGTFVNVGESRAHGWEVLVEARPVDAVRVAASFTRLDDGGEVVVSTSDFDPVYAVGEPLLRRPENQLAVWTEASVGRVSGGGSVVFVGERADSDFSGLDLRTNDAYTRVDARLRVTVVRRLQAFAAVDNLLDREYQEALGYPAAGRTVRVGLRFRSDAR